jgi:hypothetical protein
LSRTLTDIFRPIWTSRRHSALLLRVLTASSPSRTSSRS